MFNVAKLLFKVGKYLQLFNIIKKIFNRSQDDFIINKNRQNHYFNKIKIKSKKKYNVVLFTLIYQYDLQVWYFQND